MTRGVEGRKKSQRLKDAGFHECFSKMLPPENGKAHGRGFM